MTERQAANILRAISAVYTSFKPANMADVIKVWTTIFSDDNATDVMTAVYVYMSEPHEYAPTPGQVRDIMFRLKEPEAPSEAEAWSMVLRAMRNGCYHSAEEFARLPELVQAAVGSPDYLRATAASEDVSMSVEESLFCKRYRAIIEDRQRYERMPEIVKLRIESAGAQMIEGNT